MICVGSVISVISASYCREVSLHSFVKLFKLRGTWKFILYLSLDGAFRGDTERGYKCEDIMDFVNDNLE